MWYFVALDRSDLADAVGVFFVRFETPDNQEAEFCML